MKRYLVNEVFYTLQGEGVHTGRPAVFVRFSRCNLWSGREQDRATAICRFCDTDFTHADSYTLIELVAAIDAAWAGTDGRRMVVFTGGEPSLQLDAALVGAVARRGYYVAVETNGTRPLPAVNWVCVSPKAGTTLAVRKGDELKLVYPQDGAAPEDFAWLRFNTFWLSPMDGPDLADNTKAAVEYVLANPAWRLNVQTHKMIGVR